MSNLQLIILAICFVGSCTAGAYLAVDTFIKDIDSPQRKRRIRLMQLQRPDALMVTDKLQASDTASSSNGAKINKTLVLMHSKQTIAQLLNALQDLPVVRIIAKPFAVRIEERREQALRDSCMNDLPQMVDILSLSLGAGLSIDQAFEWYLNTHDTPLADQFRRAEQAYQVGMLSRMKAFEELAHSLQEEAVLRFVNALRQAFTLGAPLGPALDTLGQEVRRYRIVRIEERIAKTPVKILVPLGLCIVPAVLILLMGPIMSQVMQGFQL